MPKPIAAYTTPQPSKSLTRAVKPPTRYDDELADGHFTTPSSTESKMGKQPAKRGRGGKATATSVRKRKRTDSPVVTDEVHKKATEAAAGERKAPGRRGGRGSRGGGGGFRQGSTQSSRRSSTAPSVGQATAEADESSEKIELQELPDEPASNQPAERTYTAHLGPVLIPSVQTLNKHLAHIRQQLAKEPKIQFDDDLDDYDYDDDGNFRPKHQLYEPLRKILDRNRVDEAIDHWKGTRNNAFITLRYNKCKTRKFQHPKDRLDMSDSDPEGEVAEGEELNLTTAHPTLAVAIMDEITYACEHHEGDVFWPPEDKQSDDSAFPYLPKMATNDVLEVLLDCRHQMMAAIRERQRQEYHDVPDLAVKSRDIELAKRLLGLRGLPESLLCDYLDGEWD